MTFTASITACGPTIQVVRQPAQRMNSNDLLRRANAAARSKDLLLNEVRLTAALINRMRPTDANRPPALADHR